MPMIDAGKVDVMAHLFGLVAGIFLGAILFAVGLRRGAMNWVQIVCGVVAVGMLAVGWLFVGREFAGVLFELRKLPPD